MRRRNSLQTRMVLAYLLVGLVPMFLAAELASQAVTRVFERNLQHWLGETAAYFLAAVFDSKREASDVVRVLVQEPDMLGNLVANQRLPRLLEQMLKGEGYDLLVVGDDQGRIVYSSAAVQRTSAVDIGAGIGFLQVEHAGTTVLMVGAASNFEHAGRSYRVMLGSWLDDNFFGHLSEITSFDFRLYARSSDGYREIFTSVPDRKLGGKLDASVVSAFEAPDHPKEIFQRHADEETYAGLYRPLLDASGRTQGVVFCGLRAKLTSARWITNTTVFSLIFIGGIVLSLGVAYFVSRRLTRPLRSLTDSVSAITHGDYGSRVQVEGNDEVAELATVFNGMARQLQELADLETQLRRQDRLSALGLAAAGIAHEVRNPLGTICTSAELIRNRYQLAERDRRLIENVISEVRRIDRLVGEFLAFAKPEKTVLHVALHPSDVLRQVLHVHSPELTRRGIELSVADHAPMAQIEGDADALFQAMLNVILNAADAMEAGGRLSIEARTEAGDFILSFADDGPGVPEALRDRIFDPFFTTKDHGSGLGLAKVRSIVEAHHGRIECRDGDEGGAVFELRIPVID